MHHNARAATVGTPRTAGEKGKAIAAQSGHDGWRVARGEGEGNGLRKCQLWSKLFDNKLKIKRFLEDRKPNMPNLEEVCRASGNPTHTFVKPQKYEEVMVSIRF